MGSQVLRLPGFSPAATDAVHRLNVAGSRHTRMVCWAEDIVRPVREHCPTEDAGDSRRESRGGVDGNTLPSNGTAKGACTSCVSLSTEQPLKD